MEDKEQNLNREKIWAVEIENEIAQIEKDMANLPLRKLISCLHDEDIPLKCAAIRVLGDTKANAAIQPLVILLSDKSNKLLRVEAINALGRIKNSKAIVALSMLLLDEPEVVDVRITAIRALANIGTPSIVPTLKELIGDENPRIRIAAVKGFAALGDTTHIAKLQAKANDPDSQVRYAVEKSIEYLEGNALADIKIEMPRFDYDAMLPDAPQAIQEEEINLEQVREEYIQEVEPEQLIVVEEIKEPEQPIIPEEIEIPDPVIEEIVIEEVPAPVIEEAIKIESSLLEEPVLEETPESVQEETSQEGFIGAPEEESAVAELFTVEEESNDPGQEEILSLPEDIPILSLEKELSDEELENLTEEEKKAMLNKIAFEFQSSLDNKAAEIFKSDNILSITEKEQKEIAVSLQIEGVKILNEGTEEIDLEADISQIPEIAQEPSKLAEHKTEYSATEKVIMEQPPVDKRDERPVNLRDPGIIRPGIQPLYADSPVHIEPEKEEDDQVEENLMFGGISELHTMGSLKNVHLDGPLINPEMQRELQARDAHPIEEEKPVEIKEEPKAVVQPEEPKKMDHWEKLKMLAQTKIQPAPEEIEETVVDVAEELTSFYQDAVQDKGSEEKEDVPAEDMMQIYEMFSGIDVQETDSVMEKSLPEDRETVLGSPTDESDYTKAKFSESLIEEVETVTVKEIESVVETPEIPIPIIQQPEPEPVKDEPVVAEAPMAPAPEPKKPQEDVKPVKAEKPVEERKPVKAEKLAEDRIPVKEVKQQESIRPVREEKAAPKPDRKEERPAIQPEKTEERREVKRERMPRLRDLDMEDDSDQDANPVEKAIRKLSSRNLKDRKIALEKLKDVQSDDLYEKLIVLAYEDISLIRKEAVKLLSNQTNPGKYKHLVKLLEDEKWYIRSEAIEALARLGYKRAFEPILKLLEDENKWVAETAVKAIAEIDMGLAFDIIKELENAKEVRIRLTARDILKQYEKK